VSSTRRVVRLAGLVVLVYALLRLPADAGTPPATLSILQFNMCGNACGTRFAVVDDLEAEITGRTRQPFVVTLNEVCRGQYDRLLADLPYHGHFQPTMPNRCWDGSDYGIAVLVRSSDVGYAGSAPLPAPAGGEPRTVTCVRTAFQSRPLVACATHLDTDPANTASQVTAVAEHAGALRAGRRSTRWTPTSSRRTPPTTRSPVAARGPAAATDPGTCTRPARSTTCSCPAATSPAFRRWSPRRPTRTTRR